MTKLTREHYQVESKTHVTGLGVDSRDREIGVLIEKFKSVFTPIGDGETHGWAREAGTYYGVKPHSTRNASTYGASQSRRYFGSVDERETALAKYMKAKCKREKTSNA